MHTLRPRGQQDDLDVLLQEVEHDAHFFDDRIVTARVEEPAPVSARRFDVVLTGDGIGQHAVDVDEHGATGFHRTVAPGPVFGSNTAP